jgi:hypothetical protein
MMRAGESADGYDPQKDAHDSYYAAIEAKRLRGDAAIRKEVVIGDCRLLLGDMARILPTLGYFDLCLTDPPYGIGRDGQTKSTGGHGGRKAYEHKGWDTERPLPSAFEAIFSRSREQVIWGGNYFADMLPARGKWLVWDKGQRINQSDGELAYTSLDGALRIMTMNRVAIMKDGAEHPTQKPVELMAWCLDQMPDAKLVVDPFMGSGSSLVACIKRGRMATGIEQDPEYFEIAVRRVRDAYSRPDLFIESSLSPQPIQEGLGI